LNGGLQRKTLLGGITDLARGDGPSAAKNFDLAVAEFEKAVQEAPDAAERPANHRARLAAGGHFGLVLEDSVPDIPVEVSERLAHAHDGGWPKSRKRAIDAVDQEFYLGDA